MISDFNLDMLERCASPQMSGNTLHSVEEPATGQLLAIVRVASSEDVNRAAISASKAQATWAAMPFDQRAAILRRAAELLKSQASDVTSWTVREGGSIAAKVDWELNASYEQLHHAAGLIAQPNGYLIPSAIPNRLNMWSRVPIGVIGVIAPWNYPLLLAMRSVAPALALGNAVLLKPDLQTTISGGLVLARIFEQAGVPPGVFTVLPGGGDVGNSIVTHPLVKMISFTGSTDTGRKIGSLCGSLLKKVALELGGNNAFVVLDDADIEIAASHGAWSAFLHQGQICMQAGRHLVHVSVSKAYGEALARHAKALSVGDPNGNMVHLGPLISERQLTKVAAVVEESLQAGARLLAGGSSQALFYQPTVLVDVEPNMGVFSEEIFGPVAPITTFSTDDELIDLVNRSPYGLAAGIHTANIGRGIKIAKKLATGMVHINDQPVNAEFNVPFGGMGASGNGGRFGGLANLEEFTQSQWISYVDQPTAYPF